MSRRNIIPQKYREIHEFLFAWHDILAHIVVEGDRLHLLDANFTIEETVSDSEVITLEGEKLWEWLLANGYENITRELLQKQIYFALLSDFCHFLYEALTCSERGKLTVCFTLLRKPFKDNLLLLEWLLADPNDFIEKFTSDNSDNFAPDKIPVEKKLEIIKNAEIKAQTALDQFSHIYDLRYNKKKHFGFEPVWNQAAHIVTSFKFYKTESENLNFVFSDYTAIEDQWEQLYVSLPILIYHAVEVAITLLDQIYDDVDGLTGITKLERMEQFLLAVDEINNF
ncbi:hypothetical protein H0178_31260 [Cytobacillus firmus]|nr:hypothetical protein [Cytobacillus firmus]